MSKELVLVHITDIHVGFPKLDWRDIFSKRITGLFNQHFNRRGHFSPSLRQALVEELSNMEWDCLIITGDLTNLATEEEFKEARQILDPLLIEGKTVVIPGNHDRYVARAARKDLMWKYFKGFSPLSWKDSQKGNFFFRELSDDVVLVGVDMAVPQTVFNARGWVDPMFLENCADIIRAKHRKKIKIGVGHYPVWVPEGVHEGLLHQLSGCRFMKSFLLENDFSLYCHGHIHKSWRFQPVDGNKIHIVNSGGCCRHKVGKWAGYHRIRVSRKGVKVERRTINLPQPE